ncbi:MAG: hypothetical protein Kow002_13870 [Anaerolineales bacterium]
MKLMRKNEIISILGVLFLVLLVIGLLFWDMSTKAVETKPTPTMPFLWTGLPPETYPTLDMATASGEIAYLDLLGNQIIIANVRGDREVHIRYAPGKTYEPYPASRLKWSPDGTKLVFFCWYGGGSRIDLCILEIDETLEYGEQYKLNTFLHVIKLPLQYTPDFTRTWPRSFTRKEHFYTEGTIWRKELTPSFEWAGKDSVVLVPFCLISVKDIHAECTENRIFENLEPHQEALFVNAQQIAPSPIDENVWAVLVDRHVFLIDILSGNVQDLDIPQNVLLLSWSRDGQRLAMITYSAEQRKGAIDIVNVKSGSLKRILWVAGIAVEPRLIVEPPGTGEYFLYGNVPFVIPLGQNISWAPEDQYIIFNIFVVSPWGEIGYYLSSGTFLFELDKGELIPFQVDFQNFQVFTSPDWKAEQQ